MERGKSCKTIRRVAGAGEEREMRSRPDEMNAHEQRHSRAKENAEQREPKIVEADGLVVGAEHVPGEEAGLRRVGVTCAAVVCGHECSGETPEPPEDGLQPREQPSLDYTFPGNSRVEGERG